MTMRICIINLTPTPEEHLAFLLETMAASYRTVLDKATRVETRAVMHGPSEGTDDNFLYYFRNPFVELHMKAQMVEAILAAERDGFDAVVVNCFDDTGVREARGLVDIPVFGLGEPSLHTACQLGERIGLIVPESPGQIAFAIKQLEGHGLAGRCIANGVRKESCPLSESFPQGLQKPQEMAERLSDIGRGLVRDGADVIVIACGGLGMVCGLAGLHSIEVDSRRVPVVLPHTAALKQVESLVALRRGVDLPLPGRLSHGGMRLDRDETRYLRESFKLQTWNQARTKDRNAI